MAQAGLSYFEPAYVDELIEIMRWGFNHMQAPDGGSIYLRLSTRILEQPERKMSEADIEAVIDGAYWEVAPGPEGTFALAYTGVVAPEAREAFDQILEDIPGAGLLAVPSPDRLHRDWSAALASRARGDRRAAHIERLLSALSPRAVLATVIDGPPATLSWLGSVRGHRLAPLGLDRFGQSGDLPDLYRAYRLDAGAILDATASALVGFDD
jgi:pyruvate dehydrogenase E1 component